jgi:hypothetical protein
VIVTITVQAVALQDVIAADYSNIASDHDCVFLCVCVCACSFVCSYKTTMLVADQTFANTLSRILCNKFEPKNLATEFSATISGKLSDLRIIFRLQRT